MRQPGASKEEVFYRRWLKREFQKFGDFLLTDILKVIDNPDALFDDKVKFFVDKIDFTPVSNVFNSLATKNFKVFSKEIERLIFKGVAKKFEVKPIYNEMFLQSKATSGLLEKKSDFFETQKSMIEGDMTKVYETRKNQLESFRTSFLFNSEEKRENFLKKYPEPEYKFTDSMGRTQVNNLNRDLSATMATNLGVKEFIWRTSGDERVRESHRALNGKKFSYDNMPPEYNDYNCRCTLEPVIDYLEDLLK